MCTESEVYNSNTCWISPAVIHDWVPQNHSQGQVLNLLQVEEGGGEEGDEQGVGEEEDLVQDGVLLVPDSQHLASDGPETVSKGGENHSTPGVDTGNQSRR